MCMIKQGWCHYGLIKSLRSQSIKCRVAEALQLLIQEFIEFDSLDRPRIKNMMSLIILIGAKSECVCVRGCVRACVHGCDKSYLMVVITTILLQKSEDQ